MKTNAIQMAAKMLALTALMAFALTSCEKDDDNTPIIAKEDLVGKWEFTSFKTGTSEYMGTLVDSAGISFATISGTQGNFSQTILYADGEREKMTGKYSVNENAGEVKMIALGDTNTIKITLLTENNLEWTGRQENKTVVAKTKKK
jgi:hypothetical protein